MSKYIILKPITGKSVHEQDPCVSEFNEFVKKFGWAEEVTEQDVSYMKEDWIDWLLLHRFIKAEKGFVCKIGDKFIWQDSPEEHFILTIFPMGKERYAMFVGVLSGTRLTEPVNLGSRHDTIDWDKLTEEQFNRIKPKHGSFVKKEE